MSFITANEFNETDKHITYLRAKKETQGGYAFLDHDVFALSNILLLRPELRKEFAWLDWQDWKNAYITPDSGHSLDGESYVKTVMLENFGILCNVKMVCQKPNTKNTYWVMKGICPFHRRVHSSQNWIIESVHQNAILACYHVNKGAKRGPWLMIGHQLPLENMVGSLEVENVPPPKRRVSDSDG